nr:ribonuclease H-like domain-containing protein [Tanacetum cinerariifolium]
MTNYALWKVILNGDSPPPTRTVEGVETPYPPTTVDEKLARKNELKARGTLLIALPNKHQLKFNSYKTAKSLMEAIKKRFGGNKKSKKIQKTLLKQQYENFNGTSSEGHDQIYDRLQKIISQLKIHGETIAQEDLNMNLLRINITHGVSAASSKTNASNLPNVDSLRDRLKVADSNVDYESQKIPTKNRKESRKCKASKHQDNRNREAPRRTVPVKDTTLNTLVTQCDGLGYDWSDQAEDEPTNFVLMAYTSSSSSSSSNSKTEFWTSAKVKTVNEDVRLQALVDVKKVIVNEASIRRDLRLDDAEAFFSPQWKFLIHTILQCLSAKTTAWNEFSSTMASAIICLATTKNSTFPSIFLIIWRKQRKETEVSQDDLPIKEHIPTPSHDLLPSGEDRLQLNELMEICTKLSDMVLSLEPINTNQAVEIKKLKKRVKKLEGKKKKKRTHGLKGLYNVCLSVRIISSNEEGLGDQEDASKQERIAKIDADKDLSLINETAQDQGRMND